MKGARGTRSTIALKFLMAASGIVFIGFVLAHMYGNLMAFGGEARFNEYAEHLREIGEPTLPREGLLWVLRVGLVAALAAHLYAGITLWRRAGNARSVKYAVKKNRSTLSSRTMRWGGVTLLVFLVWHLINFTIGKVNPTGGETNNPYVLLVDTFNVWWLTAIYLVAMAALAMHLHHGVWSASQTLGLTNSARARVNAKRLGVVVAVVIAGGFSLVPIAVLTGIITK